MVRVLLPGLCIRQTAPCNLPMTWMVNHWQVFSATGGRKHEQVQGTVTLPGHLFTGNRRPLIEFEPPGVANASATFRDWFTAFYFYKKPILRTTSWIEKYANGFEVTKGNANEQKLFKVLVMDMIGAYKKYEPKNDQITAEVLYLLPVLESEAYRIC
ncbi:MAG: hypothetical protein J3Q66DRAFT_140205 [Benniella sp.]|nr:MAG: hypothetical protein J3Q66DRAFT_140205 [Benniella sp.]